MRDFVTLFVEASLAKGEWLAALNSLQLSVPAQIVAAPRHLEMHSAVSSHYHHIARTLANSGEWGAALATLRCVPSPLCSSSLGCTYSSAYLAARVRVYHAVLRTYYKEKMTALERRSPPAPPHPQSSSPDAAEWEKVLKEAFALAAEAFHLFPSTSKHNFKVGEWSDVAAASNAGMPSTSPSSLPLSGEPESTANAAELLTWYQAQLHAAPVTPSLSLEQKEAMMEQLRAASQAALRGAIVLNHITASSAPSGLSSSDAPAAAPLTHDSSTTAKKSSEASDELHREHELALTKLSPAAARAEKELYALLNRAHSARNGWSIALGLLHHLPAERFTPHMFTAFIRELARRGRRSEMEYLVRTYVFPADPKLFKIEKVLHSAAAPTLATAEVLAADSVVLKSIAEACQRLRCPQLAKELLRSQHIRANLTPSAAVPVVMVLRDAGEYAVVMEWWKELRHGEQTTQYPLLRHVKLSSYVASCVLRSSEASKAKSISSPNAGWAEALSVFEDAEIGTPHLALALLFKLRLLRQVRQWEVAMRLFSEFCVKRPLSEPILLSGSSSSGRAGRATQSLAESSRVIENIFAVLTEERAEQWVPPAALRQLRQEVAHYRRQGK